MADEASTADPALAARLAAFDARMDAFEKALAANTQATLEGNRDAREMLEIFQAVKGGFRVLGWIGTLARWVTAIAAACAVAYGVWQATHPHLPPKP